MAYKVIIFNSGENTFSINGSQQYTKGVYVNNVVGDSVGLINKHTKLPLIQPVPFIDWSTSTGINFTTLNDLLVYLATYIEVPGMTNETETDKYIFQQMLEVLQGMKTNQETIIANQELMITQLEEINTNTTPEV